MRVYAAVLRFVDWIFASTIGSCNSTRLRQGSPDLFVVDAAWFSARINLCDLYHLQLAETSAGNTDDCGGREILNDSEIQWKIAL